MAGKHARCQNCNQAQATHPHNGCTQFLSFEELQQRINRVAGEQPGKETIS